MGENMDFPSTSLDSKAGYVLSNVAEVVERILTFVPTKALFRIACVCRLWRNCARRVLRAQQRLTWLSAAGESSTEQHLLFSTLEEQLENIYLLPQMALLMVDNLKVGHPMASSRPKKARMPDPVESLKRVLPGNCDILGVASLGIVLTPSGSPCAPPQEHEHGEAGFVLLLPSMEGVNARPFHFCKQTLSTQALEEAGLVGNPDLRAVLLFGYEAYKPGASRFLNQLLKPLGQTNALIAGGHVEGVFSPHRDCCSEGAYGVVGLAVSGSRVQGASVLLDQDVSSPAAAEATLRRLKAAGIPETHTLGFMFACVGRGNQHYGNTCNVEADAFRKVFPGVPLLGFFGNGEIGCDRIVKDNYTLSDADTDALQHGYTTVMTLLHLG